MIKTIRNQNKLLFFLIFLSAALFRITNLNLIEFKADEAINLLLAAQPIFKHPFPSGGTVSSLGILNPPLFNYLLFPMTLFTLDPKIIVFIIGLLNALAIAFLFLIVKRYYGQRIGLIYGILFSLSPWAILYSRKIWMQDLITPFFVPVFYSIHKIIIERKSIYWLPYSAFCLFLIQLHQANFIFLSILTIFIMLQKVKLNLKYIVIGLLIGTVPLIPYFFYELGNGCPDCQALTSAREKLTNNRNLNLFSRPFQILSQGDFRFILGDDTLTLAKKFPLVELGRKLFYLEYLLLPLGLFVFFRKFKNLKFLAFSAIIPPVIYYFLKFEPFMHYFIILTPLLFLFLAMGFDYFITSKNALLKAFSVLSLIGIIVVSLNFNAAFFDLLKSKGALKGDFGTAYYKTDEQSRIKLRQFRTYSNYNEIYLANFMPLDYVYGYQPLGKMLYPKVSYGDVLNLENELRQNSDNPMVKQKIISFYTKDKPNLKNIELLREKTSSIPQYEPLYRQVLGDYLAQNYKKEYLWPRGGFRFFYPEHWRVTERDKDLKIVGDGYTLYLNDKGIVLSKTKTNDIKELQNSVRPL